MFNKTLLLVFLASVPIGVNGLSYVTVEDDFANLCYNDQLGFGNVYRPPNRCENLPYVRAEKREYLTYTFWCILISNMNGNISNIELEYDRGALIRTFLSAENLVQLNSYDMNAKLIIEMNSRNQTTFFHKIASGINVGLTNGFYPNNKVGRLISLKVNGKEICDPSRINEPDPIFPNQEVINSFRFYESCLRINSVRLSTIPNSCEQLNEVNVLFAYYPVLQIKIWCITINPQLSPERYRSNNFNVTIKMKSNTNFIEEHGNYDKDSRMLPYKVLYQDGSEFKISATNNCTIAIQPKNVNLSISGIQSIKINGIDSCAKENAVLAKTVVINPSRNFTHTPLPSAGKSWSVSIYFKTDYICNGTIIGPTAIITIAHCVKNLTNLIVVDRKNNIYGISNITMHRSYNQYTFDYDVAILKLTQTILFDANVEPICHIKPKSKQVDLFNNLINTITDWRKTTRNIWKPPTPRHELRASDSFNQYFLNEINYCLKYRQRYEIHFVIG